MVFLSEHPTQYVNKWDIQSTLDTKQMPIHWWPPNGLEGPSINSCTMSMHIYIISTCNSWVQTKTCK